ncbi:LacI family DNA-binding transcriptional regulator [Paenibacillus sp. LMG 31456]|uniref:LacI family DNA-binding transcriptional regulator n=1 Tax=Paenibacillus foliorum TaxID=2654974 RepID=A0A972H1Z8_9BACL|nr:LacI family DNA-binding transcriptional regulator [Paenibacillus foliorum]NOU98358.1 LacI family DNA-binding transcriptional regulator [Paenibacillus foliorum]
MTTIDDVAKSAGVSKSTVSNVFSQKRPISKEISERVLEAARELNYKPNYWARSLANKETRIIGLNMEDEKVKFGQFRMTLLNGVLEECYIRGYRLLVNMLPKHFTNRLENWSSDPVDGEILLDPMVRDPRIEERVAGGIPIVVIGRPPESHESTVSYVSNDNVGAGRQVTEYLIGLGHRNILFLNAPEHRTVSHERFDGYRKALETAELPVDAKLVVYKDERSGSSEEYGYITAKRLLSARPSITAIITDTDKVARGVYQAAEELGLVIPRDLSVFAFSLETTYGAELQPLVSSMLLNGELLGSEAAKMLLDQCAAKTPIIKRVIIPWELIHRESCGPVKVVQ